MKALLNTVATAFALALSVGVAPAARADSASASGSAFGDFVIGCTTCPHFSIPLSGSPNQIDGGAGASVAAVSYLGSGLRNGLFDDYTLGGGAAYAARASFEGALDMPVLQARAAVDNETAYIIQDPAHLPIGIDLYQASASAITERGYRYTGASASSYTFNFSVDGTVTSDLSSVFASAAIYDGSDPVYFETGLLAFGSASAQGIGFSTTPTTFAKTFAVTVGVNPGDSFYLLARLGVLASIDYRSADVAVDAYNTMRVTGISGGDPALLQTTAVPEPASALLMGLGVLALLIGTARARRPDGS